MTPEPAFAPEDPAPEEPAPEEPAPEEPAPEDPAPDDDGEPAPDGEAASEGSGREPEWQRRRRLEDVFGSGEHHGGGKGDSWYRDQVPPHHG